MTDNRNRTAADIRHIFSKHGGNLSETGSVSWMFEKKGVISFLRDRINEDELLSVALDAGAEDVEEDESFVNIITSPKNFKEVKEALEKAGYSYERAEITMNPTTTVKVEDKETAKKVLRLIEALEDHDDVQEVYSNFDISESLLDEIGV